MFKNSASNPVKFCCILLSPFSLFFFFFSSPRIPGTRLCLPSPFPPASTRLLGCLTLTYTITSLFSPPPISPPQLPSVSCSQIQAVSPRLGQHIVGIVENNQETTTVMAAVGMLGKSVIQTGLSLPLFTIQQPVNKVSFT